ncbi:unnamed protein product [Closterium sp. NIES-53]
MAATTIAKICEENCQRKPNGRLLGWRKDRRQEEQEVEEEEGDEEEDDSRCMNVRVAEEEEDWRELAVCRGTLRDGNERRCEAIAATCIHFSLL